MPVLDQAAEGIGGFETLELPKTFDRKGVRRDPLGFAVEFLVGLVEVLS